MKGWRASLKFLVLASAFCTLTGAQHQGCEPSDPDAPVVCDPVVDPECPDGQLEPGGVDDNGCALPAVCVPDVCVMAGGSPSTFCLEDDACPERDCGCQDYCDCGPTAYFDGQTCVPFPDPCSSSGGSWEEWCDEEVCEQYCLCPEGTYSDPYQGCVAPPDPNELCEVTGGTPYEWCDDVCFVDEDGDGDVEGCPEDPACSTDCDCGPDAWFDPWAGCTPFDPGWLCEATGGHYCNGTCECPWGTIYDESAGCITDTTMLCEATGGTIGQSCWEDQCWDECTCPDGYWFDSWYGCTPGPQLLCEWSGGVYGQVCAADDPELGQDGFCWDDCTCPEGTYFDWSAGCVPDYGSLCAAAGGEWTVTCDEQWGECWEDCVCPEGTYFDWIGACVVPEDCGNGVDDDGNGLVDCDDWSCSWTDVCFVEGPEVCDDGMDNDLDGLYDCEDADCFDACWIY